MASKNPALTMRMSRHDRNLQWIPRFPVDLYQRRGIAVRPQRHRRGCADADNPAQAAQLRVKVTGPRRRLLWLAVALKRKHEIDDHAAGARKPGIAGAQVGEAANQPAGARHQDDRERDFRDGHHSHPAVRARPPVDVRPPSFISVLISVAARRSAGAKSKSTLLTTIAASAKSNTCRRRDRLEARQFRRADHQQRADTGVGQEQPGDSPAAGRAAPIRSATVARCGRGRRRAPTARPLRARAPHRAPAAGWSRSRTRGSAAEPVRRARQRAIGPRSPTIAPTSDVTT